MDCDWTIEAEPGKNVHLTFLTFDIESNKDCEYDYVEVYSGLDSSVSQASYGRFCGTTVSNRQPGRASPVDVD
jgi:CUB domain.